MNNQRQWLIDNGFDDRVPANLESLTAYMQGGNGKAICIMGAVGTGKTHAMLTLFRKYMTASKLVSIYRDRRLSYDELIYGYNDVYVKEPPTVFFALDDLGSEHTLIDYGNKVEVCADFISGRYDAFKRRSCVTHITTNLSPANITDRYGARTWSRIKEMCVIVNFTGGDQRQATIIKTG